MKNLSLVSALFLVSLSVAAAKETSPEQQIDALFKQLSSGKREAAFQEFYAGTMVEKQSPGGVKALDAQAGSAWQFYGAPISIEIVERRAIGQSLFRIKFLTKSKDEIPLFWNVLFYRRAGAWEPMNLIFNDSPDKAGF